MLSTHIFVAERNNALKYTLVKLSEMSKYAGPFYCRANRTYVYKEKMSKEIVVRNNT